MRDRIKIEEGPTGKIVDFPSEQITLGELNEVANEIFPGIPIAHLTIGARVKPKTSDTIDREAQISMWRWRT